MKLPVHIITQRTLKTGKPALLFAALFFGVIYVQAALWEPPTATPPDSNNNVPAPVTPGSGDQEKFGDLVLTNLTAVQTGVFDGYVKIGDTSATCDASTEGAIRYRDNGTGVKCLQTCLAFEWRDMSCATIPPPTGDIATPEGANSADIPYDDPITIGWATSDASSCELRDGADQTDVLATGESGSYTSPPLTSDITYYLNCDADDGSGRSDLDTFNVTVGSSPVSCDLPWGGTISEGQSGVTAYQVSSGETCPSETRTCGASTGPLFIAVSYSGDRVMTSQDGINWTVRSAAGDNDSWRSIVYGEGLFASVGLSAENVMTSPDGSTWTVHTPSPTQDGNWLGVTYGGGKFVAVGFDGDLAMTSPDGVTWTTHDIASPLNLWNAVAYGNGMYVAVGIGDNRVMTSPDGVNWTTRAVSGNDDNWFDITYGEGLFVAVAESGVDRVMTSPDGINWTVRSAAGNNDQWRAITYGNGRFVAVGRDGDLVMTSPDGITWTARSAAGNDDDWLGVTYGNGLFVAVGTNGDDHVMTSPDGITWTARSAAGNDDSWYSITYADSVEGGELSGSYQYETCTVTQSYDYDFTIAADVTGYDIADEALDAGWDGTTPIDIQVTVNAGVTVGNEMTTGALPVGSTVTIINNGNIVGRGGDGATLALHGGPVYQDVTFKGYDGGDALTLTVPTTIQNNGMIAGGGGGGGSGGYTSNKDLSDGGANYLCSMGGCGAGGAGSIAGNMEWLCLSGNPCGFYPRTDRCDVVSGTGADDSQCSYGTDGDPGTLFTGGVTGGVGGADTGHGYGPGGAGGAGGDLGEPGEPGVATGPGYNTSQGGPGGAAGAAVVTNGNSLTWDGPQGDVRGPIE